MGLAIGRTRYESPTQPNGFHQTSSAQLNFMSSVSLLQVILCVVFGSACCWSQTASTGAVIGEVLDPSGGAIVHASVEARDSDTGISRSALTDEGGKFALPLLPPGTYQVMTTKAGYSQAPSISVQVLVTESIRVSIPMRVVGMTQKIEVQANVSQLQTDSTALGRVVDNRTIQTLPSRQEISRRLWISHPAS
jgi:hypothetical protein